MNLSKECPLGEIMSEESLMAYLSRHPRMDREYEGLSEKLKKEFLDFCTGAAGLNVCYDPVFKFVFNPEVHPGRLSELLSVLLKKQVKVQYVLSREGERLLEKGSLVIMDVVVELEDGSLANVEIQRVGYAFPGQRAACYSSDLVMRQFSRVRSEKGKDFLYGDLKTIYTIVIMEKSGKKYHQFSHDYVHHAKQQFETGLEEELLQEYIFVALDVFREILHNKAIESAEEAWLGFLSLDDPERIWEIQSKFPQFKEMYQDLADFRTDIREVLSMFSKSLAILDRNTERYMIEESKKELEMSKAEIEKNKAEMEKSKAEIERLNNIIKQKDQQLESLQKQSLNLS